MSIDLHRALRNATYRESAVELADPAVELLRRAGAYAERLEGPPEESYSTYGEYLGMTRPVLRERVPLDPTLPFEALKPLLAGGPFGRLLVARHPSTPAATLLALAEDEDKDVQAAVRMNRNGGVEVLRVLARSKFMQIRANVTHNELLPPDVVEQLLSDPDRVVRVNALRRKNPDGPALRKLAADSNSSVRLVVANNRKTPIDVLRSLCAEGGLIEAKARRTLELLGQP